MTNRWDNPEEWNAYLAEGNASQPRKRVSADVVLRDEAGRILLVDPAYKPDWDLPGGMAEANEAPRAAAQRELREELGLDITVGTVLCVDWVPPHGPWDDSLAFLFDGGVLGDAQLQALDLFDGELRGYRLVPLHDIEDLVRPRLWRRLQQALDNPVMPGGPYLEDGAVPPATPSAVTGLDSSDDHGPHVGSILAAERD